MSGRRAQRRGFWLLELLFVIGLLGVVGFMAAKLFGATIRLGQNAAAGQNHAATLDSVAAALRTDAWAMTKFDVTGSATATLHLPGERTVVWSIAGDSITRRENDGPLHQWPIPAESTFAAEDVTLVLRLHGNRTTVAGEARFPSQVKLIARLAS